MMSNSKTYDEDAPLSEADEIAALLPWYVSGRISAADKARVESYAQSHPEIAAHIALAREEADAVFADNQELQPPRAAYEALDAAKAKIEASPSARLYAVRTSFVDRVGEYLAGLAPRQLAYAGIAATLAIAVQAASIGELMRSAPTTGGYQTASDGRPVATDGSFALVAFQPLATAKDVTQFLSDNAMTIADGPRPGGLYRVRLGAASLPQGELEAALVKLQGRSDLVAFVSATPSAP